MTSWNHDHEADSSSPCDACRAMAAEDPSVAAIRRAELALTGITDRGLADLVAGELAGLRRVITAIDAGEL